MKGKIGYKIGAFLLYLLSGMAAAAAGLGAAFAVEAEYHPDDFILAWLWQMRYPLMGGCIAAAMITVGLLIWLICAAGWKNGELRRTFPDRVPYEVMLLLSGAAVILFGYCIAGLLTELDEEIMYLSGFALLGAMGILAVGGGFLMNTAVRIKTRTFWESTLLCPILRFIGKAFRALPLIWREVLLLGGIVFVELVILSAEVLLPLILFNLLLLGVLCYELVQWKKITRFAEQLAAGDLAQKLDTRRMVLPLKAHAEHLNAVSDGVERAVTERLKSERMRTELITNVSHDLKTPLTALISYVDLLKREGTDSPNASGYLDVLDKQSAKLKKLTDDLIEAAKASSGVLPAAPVPMHLGEFLNQSLGEYAEAFAARALTLIRNGDDDFRILADGRHLWRVLDNLLNNVKKYAMPGTRVYLDVQREGNAARIILRNISEVPLNLSADELMERFVRGDASRGEKEGSGLGLSIADSLMKLQNGSLSLAVTADLFTAMLTIPVV